MPPERTSKETLVVKHAAFARSLAFRHRRGLSLDQFEDLVAEAYVGLVEAADRFDGKRLPAKLFLSFAKPRILGRIGDELAAVRGKPKTPKVFTNAPAAIFDRIEDRSSCSDDDSEHVSAALQRLPSFEAWVVREHFGIGTAAGRSLREIAEESGLSRRQVTAVVALALDKLKLLVVAPPESRSSSPGRLSATA